MSDPLDNCPWLLCQCLSQARILEWIAILFPRGSFQPRDWTQVSWIGRWILYRLNHQGSPCGELSPKDVPERNTMAPTPTFFSVSKYLTEKMKLPSNKNLKEKKNTTYDWQRGRLISCYVPRRSCLVIFKLKCEEGKFCFQRCSVFPFFFLLYYVLSSHGFSDPWAADALVMRLSSS